MSPVVLAVIVGIVAIALGILIGYILRKNVAEKTIGSAEQKARNLILDAENRSETIKKEVTLEAKEEAHKMRSDVEKEVRERRAEIQRAERRVVQKEENVDRKLEGIEKKEERITQHEKDIARKREEISKVFDRKIAELEKISGYTAEEAKALLLEGIEKDCRLKTLRQKQKKKRIEMQKKSSVERFSAALPTMWQRRPFRL